MRVSVWLCSYLLFCCEYHCCSMPAALQISKSQAFCILMEALKTDERKLPKHIWNIMASSIEHHLGVDSSHILTTGTLSVRNCIREVEDYVTSYHPRLQQVGNLMRHLKHISSLNVSLVPKLHPIFQCCMLKRVQH